MKELWERATSARYNAGVHRGHQTGFRLGMDAGKALHQEAAVAYLEQRMAEFAEPFGDDGVRLGFASAIEELKGLK
jgi:flagellar biosynthesis/type III secretory pathway protein FliH